MDNKNEEFYELFSFEFINLKLVSTKDALKSIDFVPANTDIKTSRIDILQESKKQLNEYFNKKRKSFSIPLSYKVSPLGRLVLEYLLSIPYGEARSYKQVGEAINSKAYRAIGNVNAKNPLPIVIPCHRVIRANSSLGGYNGGFTQNNIKQFLLELEGFKNLK